MPRHGPGGALWPDIDAEGPYRIPSGESPVSPEALDVNALVTERVSFIRPAHPDTTSYNFV